MKELKPINLKLITALIVLLWVVVVAVMFIFTNRIFNTSIASASLFANTYLVILKWIWKKPVAQKISSNINLGGIAVTNDGGTIKDCFSIINVKGGDNSGKKS